MDKKQCSESCSLKHIGYKISEGFGGFQKSILFVAHRGDERVLENNLFWDNHEQALLETDSGKSLMEILDYCKLGLKDIRFTNIVKCLLPQKEKIPEEAYTNCEINLREDIESTKPKAIVAFGESCFKYMFPGDYKGNFLKEIGKIYSYYNKPVLITHHLSKIYRLQKPNEAEKIRKFLEDWVFS